MTQAADPGPALAENTTRHELQKTLEELRIAEVELRAQSESLQRAHNEIEVEPLTAVIGYVEC